MNINKLLMTVKKGVIKNLPTIMSIGSSIVTVASVATAVKATTKAVKIINEEKEKNPEITKTDIIKATWKVYLPTIILTAVSVAGNIGGNVISLKRQAALASAYGLLQSSFAEYKKWVRERDAELSYDKFLSEKATSEPEPEYILEEVYTEPPIWLYNPFDKDCKYIKTTMSSFNKARYELNALASMLGSASLYDFFDLLNGKKPDGTAYLGPDNSHCVGWCIDPEYIDYSAPFIEVNAHELNKMIKDIPVMTLEFGIEPYIEFDNFISISDLK